MSNNYDHNSLGSSSVGLSRVIGLREGITITVGMVVGVGLFTVGANCVGELGGMIILASFIALLISYWPAMLYGEMSAALPYAGGTYNFARKGLSKGIANVAGWNYIVANISVCGGETLAFSYYFQSLFKGFGIELDIDPRIYAVILLTVFVIINYRGIRVAAKFQNARMFFFWACSIVWFITMIPNIELANYFPEQLVAATGFREFVMIVGLVWWCFAGYETIVGMGGEVKYPQITIPRILKVAPFFVFGITALFQWFLVGVVPPQFYDVLRSGNAPFAEGLLAVGYVGFPVILLCVAIAFGGDLSTINPAVGGPSRYIFQMANEGCLPAFFCKVHPKYKTPHLAILAVGVITLCLILTDSIIYIASLSLFSTLICYIIGFCAYIGLNVRNKDLIKPYKAPAGMAGAVFSIIVYLLLASQIGTEAMLTGLGFTVFSIIFYFVKVKVLKKEVKDIDIDKLIEKDFAVPGAAETVKMKREYIIWQTVGICVAVVALMLFMATLLFGG